MTSSLKITLLMVLCLSMSFSTSSKTVSNVDEAITVNSLSKKWKLEKYKVFFFSEDPEAKEKNDYIHLKSDMTFDSVSEGVFEKGTWRLDATKKRLYLSQKGEQGELVLIIEELSNSELIVTIDDPSDDDASYLKIHFKN